jgi:arginase
MSPRRARVFVVPYDSGIRHYRMGAGPPQLIERGIAQRIEPLGYSVSVEEINPDGSPPHAEIAAAFSIARNLSQRVRAAVAAGEFPLVLSGNCNTSLGTISGLDRSARGVIWFDAHGDFNTPETTIGGFLDGMSLAAITGRCWKGLTQTIPDFERVPDANVIQLGARDFDPAEADALEASAIARAGADAASTDVNALLEQLSKRVEGTYLHLDLDVLDSAEGKANTYASAGGYTREGLTSLLERNSQTIPVKAMAVTAYDPAADSDGRVTEAAMEFVSAVLRTSQL